MENDQSNEILSPEKAREWLEEFLQQQQEEGK